MCAASWKRQFIMRICDSYGNDRKCNRTLRVEIIYENNDFSSGNTGYL